MNLIAQVLKPLRFLLIVSICALLIFSSTVPAFAASDGTREGKAGKIYTEKSEEALRDAPQSLKAVQKRTEGGLNEVQGKAGIQDMKRPSNSQGVISPMEQVEKALDKAQNK